MGVASVEMALDASGFGAPAAKHEHIGDHVEVLEIGPGERRAVNHTFVTESPWVLDHGYVTCDIDDQGP